MPKEKSEPPVGSEEPRRPEYSLPRYDEPTPETHRKLSREGEAELALKRTEFTSGARRLLIALFLVTIALVPAIQIAAELRAPRPSGGLATLDLYKLLPARAKIRQVRNLAGVWRLLPRAADLKATEKELERDSVVSQWLLPRVQAVLTGQFRAGNEQVYLGRDGWLFYRPDVEYITGPPFLDPSQMRHRTGVQPDPVKAIVDFRNQLAARGIELITVPLPVKPGIDADKLSAHAEGRAPLHNASFAEFKARLEKAGLRVFDPSRLMMERKTALNGAPLYLESDTHWRPETMEFVAEQLAALIKPAARTSGIPVQIIQKEITGFGDMEKMLKLPAAQKIYQPEKVTIHQIALGNDIWRPSKDADILLLGDSFSNIFSLDAAGWGESAGFAEQLSRVLGRPLDCVLRNGEAAYATRKILSRELAQGRDRLAGKKLVVWEFTERELTIGDWKLLDLKLGTPPRAHFFVPKTGEKIVATGMVEAVSNLPRPGTAPYKDHIFALHLTDLAAPGHSESESLQVLVYLWSMRDNTLTAAARIRPGDRVTLRLRPWAEVSEQYEKINRSEIDDAAVQLEEPCWGELP